MNNEENISNVLNQLTSNIENVPNPNISEAFINKDDKEKEEPIIEEKKVTAQELGKIVQENNKEKNTIEYPGKLGDTKLEKIYIGLILNEIKAISVFNFAFEDCYFSDEMMLEIYKKILFTDGERYAPTQIKEKFNFSRETQELYETLSKKYRMECDTRENYTPGYKFNDWEMRGVPTRIELGPRDIENGECVVVRRDTSEKIVVKLDELETKLEKILDDIQINMFNECKANMERRTSIVHNLDEFVEINTNQGLIKSMWCGSEECENKIKELTGAHSRCMPFEKEVIGDKCVCCGKPADKYIIWGRQY